MRIPVLAGNSLSPYFSGNLSALLLNDETMEHGGGVEMVLQSCSEQNTDACVPVLLLGESQPNCTDDFPPGSFVTREVVLFPSIKTFWFSFIPYMSTTKEGGRKMFKVPEWCKSNKTKTVRGRFAKKFE